MTEELHEKAIEIRSEEMDELLTRVPSWLIRRGAVLLTFIVIFLLVGSWFFHYPDSIVATITITSANPPSSVVARTGGKLISFLVNDQQDVRKGDYLAVLENSSDIGSVNKLLLLFHTVDTLSNPAGILELNIEQLSNLGDLQSYYINFLQAYRAYNRYQSSLLNKKKIMALQQQIDLSSIYVNKLDNQKRLQEKELKIAQSLFNRDSLLFTKKIISPAQFEKSQTQMINSIYTFKNSEMTLINSQIQVDQLRQQVIEVQLTKEKEIQQLIDDVRDFKVNNLLSA
jgi:multidrug resistance efflux pump